MNNLYRKKKLLINLGVAAAISIVSNASLADFDPLDLNISALRTDEALLALARDAGIQIVFSPDTAELNHSPAISGRYAVDEAMEILLAETDLGFEVVSDKMIVVRKREGATERRDKKESGRVQEELNFNKNKIEEILVTASKRGSGMSIQNTAMAISALDSDTIAKRNLVGMDDYLRTLPGVSMQDRGASQNNIIIRGIGADPQIEKATTGIYFGETPVTGLGSTGTNDLSGSGDLKLVDIERIEVLRGPQGTLYGSGSMGGTVRIIPNAPNLQEVEGRIATRYSQTDKLGSNNTMVQGVINIPLIEDELGIRAVAYQFDNSGSFESIGGSNDAALTAYAESHAFGNPLDLGGMPLSGDDIGSDKYTGFRVTALWQPTDELGITLAYAMQDIKQEGYPEFDLNLGGFQQVRLAGPDGEQEFLRADIDITSLTIEYDLGWGAINSSSSLLNYEAAAAQDNTFIFGGFPYFSVNTAETEVFVEELRLSSRFNGPIQFVTGFYYEDRELDDNLSWLWSGTPFPDSDFFAMDKKEVEQKAIFGELSYEITETLTATVGMRYFEYDDKVANVTNFVPPPNNMSSIANGESNKTFKVNLTYKPNEDILLYGQWAEGFRLGQALNSAALASICDQNNDGLIDDIGIPAPSLLESDNLESFELGIKSSLADDRVTLNAAIFRVNWDGIPVAVVLPSCFSSTRLNAGNSKAEGVELEIQAALTDRLRMDVSTSYIESSLTEDHPQLGNAGDDLPGSSDFNLSLGMEYGFSLIGREAFARFDYAYVSGYFSNIAKVGPESGGFGQAHFKTGINLGDFDVDLFVNNLTNADDLTWVELSGLRAFRLRPRTIGLNLAYRF